MYDIENSHTKHSIYLYLLILQYLNANIYMYSCVMMRAQSLLDDVIIGQAQSLN